MPHDPASSSPRPEPRRPRRRPAPPDDDAPPRPSLADMMGVALASAHPLLPREEAAPPLRVQVALKVLEIYAHPEVSRVENPDAQEWDKEAPRTRFSVTPPASVAGLLATAAAVVKAWLES